MFITIISKIFSQQINMMESKHYVIDNTNQYKILKIIIVWIKILYK